MGPGRVGGSTTHEHMASEHATDTNESEKDTKSQTRILLIRAYFLFKLEMIFFSFFSCFFFCVLLAVLFIILFTFGQVKNDAHPPTNHSTNQSVRICEIDLATLEITISLEDGKIDVAFIEESARDEGGYDRFDVRYSSRH